MSGTLGWEVTLREHSAMYVFHIAAIVHAMSGACLTLFTPLPVLIQPMFLDGCWQWGVDKKGGAVSSEGHERRRGTCAQEPEREEEEQRGDGDVGVGGSERGTGGPRSKGKEGNREITCH